MELRQLEYFVAVADQASFTRAARLLHVAQPGVSAQMRQLERELGQELLDRSGRKVRLTPAGSAVLPYARAALDAAGGVRQVADELAELRRGEAAFGMVTGCGGIGVPDLLAAFHGEHPAIEISLVEDASDRLAAAVTGGTLDVALIGRSGPALARLDRQIVIDDALVAAVQPGHPLSDRSAVGLSELAKLPLISLPRGTGLRTALDEACAAAGLQPTIAFEAADPKILAELARRGLGVAILAASMIGDDPGSLHGLEIVRPQLRGRIELVWRASGPISPAARALIAAARRFFDERGLGG
ncbi:MAG TPA: LysR substrate-binding domain-containing protein [Solirubrobacteraceae bacterium]|jgi:DNA-binding transcriptional LysR family regulator